MAKGISNTIIPNLEILNKHFYYNPNTGLFKNKFNKSSNARKNRTSGTTKPDGYIYLRINKKPYYAHRIAWKMFYKKDPPKMIDHIDRNPSNNKISNLRAATMSLNMLNRGRPSIRHRCQKWYARIKINYKEIYLGAFKTKKEAIKAYNDKKMEVFNNAKIS